MGPGGRNRLATVASLSLNLGNDLVLRRTWRRMVDVGESGLPQLRVDDGVPYRKVLGCYARRRISVRVFAGLTEGPPYRTEEGSA